MIAVFELQVCREIISITAQLLGAEKMRTVGRFDAFVRPQLNPKLTSNFVRTTRITQRMVDGAESFPTVYQLFTEFCGDAEVVYSWGNCANVLLQNMRWYDDCVDYAFLLKCKDVRPVFAEAGVPVSRFDGRTIYLAFEDEELQSQTLSAGWEVESIVRALRKC